MGNNTGDPQNNPIPCLCRLNALAVGSEATHALLDASHLRHCPAHSRLVESPKDLWNFALRRAPQLIRLFVFFECVAMMHKANRPDYPKTPEEQQSRAQGVLRLNVYRTRNLEKHPQIERIFSIGENDQSMSWAMAHLANALAISAPNAKVEIWGMDSDFFTTTGSKYTVMYCPTRRRYPSYHQEPILPRFSLSALTPGLRNAIVLMRSIMGNDVYAKGASGLESKYQALTTRNLTALITANVHEDLWTQSGRIATYEALVALKERDQPPWVLTDEERQTAYENMDRNDLLQYEPLALIIHRMSPSPSPNRAIIYSCICKALDVTFVETHSDRINSLATEPTVSGSESAVVISALFATLHLLYPPPAHSEKSAWTEQVRALIRDVVADKPITPNPKTNELYEATCFFLPAIHFLLEPALKTSVNPAGLAAYLSHPDFLALVNRQHTAHALPPANFQEDILAGRRLPFPPYTAVRPLTQAEIATVNESNLPSALLLQLQDDHEQLDFHERVARELALEADNDARWDLVSSHIYREERKLPRLEVLPREIFSIICLSRFAKAYKRNDFLAAQEAMVAFLSIFSTANYRNVLNVFESVRRSTLDPELQEFLDELVPPEIRNTVLLSANTRFEFEHPELMAYIQQHSSHTTHKPLSYAKIFTDAYVQEGAPSFPAWYAERVRHGATEIKIGSTTFSAKSSEDSRRIRTATLLLLRSGVIDVDISQAVISHWQESNIEEWLHKIASAPPWDSCTDETMMLCLQWDIDSAQNTVDRHDILQRLLQLPWLSPNFDSEFNTLKVDLATRKRAHELNVRVKPLHYLAQDLSDLLPHAALRAAAFSQDDNGEWIQAVVAPFLHGSQRHQALAVDVIGAYAKELVEGRLVISQPNVRSSEELYRFRYLDWALEVAVFAAQTNSRRFTPLQMAGLWVKAFGKTIADVPQYYPIEEEGAYTGTALALLSADAATALRSAGIAAMDGSFLCDMVSTKYLDQPSFAVSCNLAAAICFSGNPQWHAALQSFPRSEAEMRYANRLREGKHHTSQAADLDITSFFAILFLADIPLTSDAESRITHDLASELVGDRFLRQVSGSRTEGSWCFQLFMRFALRILLWANNMGDLPTWEWCLDQRPTGMTAFRARTLLKPLKYKIFTPWLTENKIGRVNLDLQAAFLPLDAAPPTGDLEEAESNVNQSVSDCRGRLLDLGWSTPSDERWSALRRFPVLDEFADVDCCLGLVPECKERMRELLLLRGYLSTRLPVQDRATYRDDIRARDVDLDELSD